MRPIETPFPLLKGGTSRMDVHYLAFALENYNLPYKV
jgi:hypothetical protein